MWCWILEHTGGKLDEKEAREIIATLFGVSTYRPHLLAWAMEYELKIRTAIDLLEATHE